MSDTVNQAGKWLGMGWNRLGTETGDFNGLLSNYVMFGSAIPGLSEWGLYSSAMKSGDDWQTAGNQVAAEEKAKKDEEAEARQQILDIINRPPPEQPTFEWPTYEMPQIPQWTPPPTQVATPKVEPEKAKYTPRRTTTVLTKPGDVQPGGKGKKKLLGE